MKRPASGPNWDEILGWLAASPGRSAEDVVDRWFKGEPDRSKALARVRQRISRSKRAAGEGSSGAGGGPTEDPIAEGPPRPEPDTIRPALSRPEFLAWELSELLADLAWVRAAGLVGRVAQLDARVAEVRLQLDHARADQGEGEDLDERPEVIAKRMREREKLLNELTAAGERRDRNL